MELWSLAGVRREIPWSLLRDLWRVLNLAADTSCCWPCWLRWGARTSCAVGAETTSSLFQMLTWCSSLLMTRGDVWAWGKTKYVEVGVGKIQLKDTMLWRKGVPDGLGFIGGGRQQGRQPRWREGGGCTHRLRADQIELAPHPPVKGSRASGLERSRGLTREWYKPPLKLVTLNLKWTLLSRRWLFRAELHCRDTHEKQNVRQTSESALR